MTMSAGVQKYGSAATHICIRTTPSAPGSACDDKPRAAELTNDRLVRPVEIEQLIGERHYARVNGVNCARRSRP